MTAFADRTVVTIAVRGLRVCGGKLSGLIWSAKNRESRELAGGQSRILGCLRY